MRSPFDVLLGRVSGYSLREIARRTVPCQKYVYEPGHSSPILQVCLLVDSKYLYLFVEHNLKGIKSLEAKARYLKGDMAGVRLREFQPGYCRLDQVPASNQLAAGEPVDPNSDLDLLYEVARSNLTDQLSLVGSLDTKLGIILAGGTALVALAVAVFATNPSHISLGPSILLGLTAMPYAVLLWQAYEGLKSRDWDTGPRLESVISGYRSLPHKIVAAKVIETLMASYYSNETEKNAKQIALHRCTRSLAATGFMVVATVGAFVFIAST